MKKNRKEIRGKLVRIGKKEVEWEIREMQEKHRGVSEKEKKEKKI